MVSIEILTGATNIPGHDHDSEASTLRHCTCTNQYNRNVHRLRILNVDIIDAALPVIVLWIRYALRSRKFGTSQAWVNSCENLWSLNLRHRYISAVRPSLIDHIKQNGCCERMLLSFAILEIRIIKHLILMMNGIIKHLIFEDQNRWWNSMVSLNIPTFQTSNCVRSLKKNSEALVCLVFNFIFL